jgi:hypothetical protein
LGGTFTDSLPFAEALPTSLVLDRQLSGLMSRLQVVFLADEATVFAGETVKRMFVGAGLTCVLVK